MSTSVTIKGQVTLPKDVRDAVGIRPGDRVRVRATSSGAVVIEKDGQPGFDEILAALQKAGVRAEIDGNELMNLTRDED
jgi:AbrB family looped-hinge helix DNA binding protein